VSQRLLKGRLGVGLANILIEIKLREGGDDHHLGGKLHQELRHPVDQLGKLKARERPRQHDLLVELRKGHAPPLGQVRHQARVDAVGAIEKQDALALQRQARQKVVAQAGRMALPVKNRQAARRQAPGLT
jgi:hypothetical protein